MPQDLEDLLDDCSKSLLSEFKGVTATPVTPLAREWLALGNEVSVFCLDPSVPDSYILRGERLVIHVLPRRRFRLSAFDNYATERQLIRNAVAQEKPEVLSAQWSYEHALAALDTGLPTVVTCHDTPWRYAWISKTLFMSYHVAIAALVFHRARYLVAVSPYTSNHIRKYFRPSATPQTIPNGLPEHVFERGATRFSQSPLNNPVFTICSVGGWGKIKNVTALLEAFAQVRASGRCARLVLFGNGLGEGQGAETWAVQHSLSEGVEFRGSEQRERILDFLASETDLMVHPSKIECHPMVLIESIACGVPVVAGVDSGGVAWTLGDGKHGSLCDITDPAQIAQRIIHVIDHPEETRSATKTSWSAFKKQFGIQTVASRFLELFGTIPLSH